MVFVFSILYTPSCSTQPKERKCLRGPACEDELNPQQMSKNYEPNRWEDSLFKPWSYSMAFHISSPALSNHHFFVGKFPVFLLSAQEKTAGCPGVHFLSLSTQFLCCSACFGNWRASSGEQLWWKLGNPDMVPEKCLGNTRRHQDIKIQSFPRKTTSTVNKLEYVGNTNSQHNDTLYGSNSSCTQSTCDKVIVEDIYLSLFIDPYNFLKKWMP